MVLMAKGNGGTNGNDHALNYVTQNRFYVEIDSSIKASFTECSNLGATINKKLIKEGGVNHQQRFCLADIKFTDVKLKRGVTDDTKFWQWISQVLDEDNQDQPIKRPNVRILVFNQAGETMQSWTLIGAVPIGWKVPTLQADGNKVVIEELTIAYEGLKVYKKEDEKVEKLNFGRNGHDRDENDYGFPGR
jgi:phage tail-like protein